MTRFQIKPMGLLLASGISISPMASAAEPVAAQDDCQSNMKTFVTAGGVLLGTYLGNQIGDGKAGATLIGGLLGGVFGNYIGSELDRRHCELKKIAKNNQVEFTASELELTPSSSQSDVATKSGYIGKSPQKDTKEQTSGKVDVATWHGIEHFVSGSDKLTPEAIAYFSAAAKQYLAKTAADAALAASEKEVLQNGKTLSAADKKTLLAGVISAQNLRPIVLIGHTDDMGDSQENQKLSERRARAVALLFKQQGIPASRLFLRGAGEIDPTADNRTEKGRKANRRVEVVELESKEKLLNYIALKENNASYYRPKVTKQEISSSGVEVASVSEQVSPKLQNSTSAKVTPRTQRDNGRSTSTSVASTRAQQSEGALATPPLLSSPQTASMVTAPIKSDSRNVGASEIDFGGVVFDAKSDTGIEKAIGAPIQPKKGFSDSLSSLASIFESDAKADSSHVYAVPCTADVPRYGGQYLSLETGKAVNKVADYSPGLYQTTWTGTVNGNYLAVTPVAVLRNSFEAASKPNVLMYANTLKPTHNSKANAKIVLQVNIYPGQDGILYRVYPEARKAGFVCMDLVLPHSAPFVAKLGKLYYNQVGKVFVSSYKPEMLTVAANK